MERDIPLKLINLLLPPLALSVTFPEYLIPTTVNEVRFILISFLIIMVIANLVSLDNIYNTVRRNLGEKVSNTMKTILLVFNTITLLIELIIIINCNLSLSVPLTILMETVKLTYPKLISDLKPY